MGPAAHRGLAHRLGRDENAEAARDQHRKRVGENIRQRECGREEQPRDRERTLRERLASREHRAGRRRAAANPEFAPSLAVVEKIDEDRTRFRCAQRLRREVPMRLALVAVGKTQRVRAIAHHFEIEAVLPRKAQARNRLSRNRFERLRDVGFARFAVYFAIEVELHEA